MAVFLAAYFLPVRSIRVQGALVEAFAMLHEYAREHVLLCLVPALFIAGAIAVFVSQASVMRYFGPAANKALSYSVASVSGTILAVCSCTVLPLFAGIYTRGAGIGPATAFLYSGPAINVLAIILTARVLGAEMGIARAVGAIAFAIVIGISMHLIFLREERAKAEEAEGFDLPPSARDRPLWQTGAYFAVIVGILVFANWGKPVNNPSLWATVYGAKWFITATLLVVLAIMLIRWFRRSELKEWTNSTWTFAWQILPLLFGGVLVAGFLLGRPGHAALIPEQWVARLVGGNSLWANLFAAVSGALMYFATLTEVPILQGLLGAGMGKGPALALLLAGPSLSLPNLLVIGGIMGARKTIVYASLVVVLATATGVTYGAIIT
ncbi:MAG: permease [Armatimonadetes bacterium]|nr:permease [Armatimonadota bacterium]NIM22951.1 permease [Armatimonadota bacterium]NIM66822.1 permease [Armatimonadota bacterium]NIM75363.1 permease [Armatimonadota bacterium]NIN05010.1 permease [Armatimonadota bacterium]